jgi:hypothetical protein
MISVLPLSYPFDAVCGPFYDSEGVARLLRTSVNDVTARSQAHTLLACRTAEGVAVFPTFQFNADHTQLAGMSAVLTALVEGTGDSWQVALWLRTPHAKLHGQTPVDALAEGRTTAVQELAEQTAARWRH